MAGHPRCDRSIERAVRKLPEDGSFKERKNWERRSLPLQSFNCLWLESRKYSNLEIEFQILERIPFRKREVQLNLFQFCRLFSWRLPVVTWNSRDLLDESRLSEALREELFLDLNEPHKRFCESFLAATDLAAENQNRFDKVLAIAQHGFDRTSVTEEPSQRFRITKAWGQNSRRNRFRI